MPWTFTLRFKDGSEEVFSVADSDRAMPVLHPKYGQEFDDSEPPKVVAVTETWTIRDAYLLAQPDTEAMVDKLLEIVARAGDPVRQIVGLEYALDGVPKFRMDTTTLRLGCRP